MTSDNTGQAAVETLVTLGVILAALVGMAIYVQRGYQGHLFSGAAAQGLQFDPRRTYLVNQTLQLTQRQEIQMERGRAAVRLIKGQGAPLPDHIGRLLGTKATVTTTWNLTRDASYEAQQ